MLIVWILLMLFRSVTFLWNELLIRIVSFSSTTDRIQVSNMDVDEEYFTKTCKKTKINTDIHQYVEVCESSMFY